MDMDKDRLQELIEAGEIEYHSRKKEPTSGDGEPRFPTIKVRKSIDLQRITKEAKR